MILETLDIKINDIIIYSQNKFEPRNNFKIIYKDDPKKESKLVGFSDVCKFVDEFNPKNLIVYRLLTNIPDFKIVHSKYGHIINIHGEKELIYFDPVYALKELEDYSEAIDYYDLRFRIQQIGLTTLNRLEGLANFAEIYNIDLEATETKYQNDKTFIDALSTVWQSAKKSPVRKEIKTAASNDKIKASISKNKIKSAASDSKIKAGTSDIIKQKQRNVSKPDTKRAVPIKKQGKEKAEETKNGSDNISQNHRAETNADGIRIISHDISEDKDFDYREIMKIGMKKVKIASTGKTLNPSSYKGISEKTVSKENTKAEEKESLRSFFYKKQNENIKVKGKNYIGKEYNSQMIEIFKSPESLNNFLEGKRDKKVVLRMNMRK